MQRWNKFTTCYGRKSAVNSCHASAQISSLAKAVSLLLAFVLTFSLVSVVPLDSSSAFALEETDAAAIGKTALDASSSSQSNTGDSGSSSDGSSSDQGQEDKTGSSDTDFDNTEATHPAQKLTATVKDTDITVQVEAGKGVLPKDATVKAVLVDKKEITDALEQKAEADGNDLGAVKAIDVTIYDKDGNEIQPNGSVKVTFSNTDLNDDQVSVFHLKEDNDGYVAEDMKTVSADANEQVFETEHFSIYAIVDSGATVRLKVVFHQIDGSESAVFYVNKTEIPDIPTTIYDPGVNDPGADRVFRGWTTEQDYNQNTESKTIDDICGLVIDKLNQGVTEGEELHVYPMIFKIFRVTYLGENGSALGSETSLLMEDETSSTYTVNMGYTPSDPAQSFVGWRVVSGGDNINGYTPDSVYPNGTEITLTGSVVFSVDAPRGYWLVFDENGASATYNAPQFVKHGEVTVESIHEMKRTGYTFGGWYTDKNCTAGNEFSFGGTLTSDTTIYAK